MATRLVWFMNVPIIGVSIAKGLSPIERTRTPESRL